MITQSFLNVAISNGHFGNIIDKNRIIYPSVHYDKNSIVYMFTDLYKNDSLLPGCMFCNTSPELKIYFLNTH